MVPEIPLPRALRIKKLDRIFKARVPQKPGRQAAIGKNTGFHGGLQIKLIPRTAAIHARNNNDKNDGITMIKRKSYIVADDIFCAGTKVAESLVGSHSAFPRLRGIKTHRDERKSRESRRREEGST